jgi:hypothetical protein
MRHYLPAIALLALTPLLGGCPAPSSTPGSTASSQFFQVLTKINATGQADLLGVEAVAKAATPADLDGYNCAAAAITVAGQIQQVNTAASSTTGAGVLTAAEMGTLFAPGSAQFNQAQNTLASGCIAKANDVVGPAGVAVGGGVIGLLNAGKLLPLVAAP